eukprot:TRINITY_DN17058_c0_g1_i1.p1 TRINITY_DN17058_c0_g1~~TRINITY_DN17058_c0_g1_i1.p1  ORF type:complete len:394 (+),score=81.65 TRINITY_DN17058_c0_g1_i1:69-1250(+)
MHSATLDAALREPSFQVTALASQQMKEKLAARRQRLHFGSGEVDLRLQVEDVAADAQVTNRGDADSLPENSEEFTHDVLHALPPLNLNAMRQAVHDVVQKADDGTLCSALALSDLDRRAEEADDDSCKSTASQDEHEVWRCSDTPGSDPKECMFQSSPTADLMHRGHEANASRFPEEFQISTMPPDEFFIYTPRDSNLEVPSERGSADCRPSLTHISEVHVCGKHSSQISRGYKVKLHIYDVSREPFIHRLNKLLAHESAPIKLGGIFHAAIEVRKVEWSYGSQAKNPEVETGVRECEPKADPQHSYRQTKVLGRTTLSKDQIAAVVDDLKLAYAADDYDLLRKNCCHFADDLCSRLGVAGLPRWLFRLAELGAGLDELLQQAPEPVRELLPW